MIDKSEGNNNIVVKNPVGRPTSYTEEYGIEICNLLSKGETIRGLNKTFPTLSRSVIYDWLNNFPEFRSRYARSLAERTDQRFDKILEVASNGSEDYKCVVTQSNGDKVVINNENIQRSRLLVDTLKWTCGKENPAKYGEKVAVDLTGNIEHTHEHKLVVTDDMKTILHRAGVETDEE